METFNQKVSILIADDHEIVRMGFRFMLNDTDRFSLLEEAINGFEAYELAKFYKPDLIIMDYLLPDENGIEAARRIKEVLPNVKIMLFTGFEELLFIDEIILSGINAFLTKDISRDNFIYSIENVMQDNFVFTKNVIKAIFDIGYSNFILNEKPVILSDEISESLRLFNMIKDDKVKNQEKDKIAGRIKSHLNSLLSENNFNIKQQIA